MLPEIHEAIRRLLHERGNIDPREVEVLFEAPTRERIERLTRPAISLYLIGVQENTDLRKASFDSTRTNQHAERRMAPRRIDLRYLVSALTTDADDEHRLLWRALGTLLRYQQFPMELLPDGFQQVEPALTARAAQPDDSLDGLAVWSGLGSAPRPSFWYILTAPLDLEIAIQAPLVLTRTARYVGARGDVATPESRMHIGGFVRDGGGQPLAAVAVSLEGSAAVVLTAADGSFRLPGVSEGAVTLRLTLPDGAARKVTVQVPSEQYEIVLA